MLPEIFDNIYNIYNSKDVDKLLKYIYDNYEQIIDIIEKVIEYDKNATDKYIFFYKGYTNVDDFYSYFNILNTDKKTTSQIYEMYLLFVISLRIVILNTINNNADFSLKGREEMTFSEDMDFPKKTIYRITTTNNEKNIKKFACYILIFYLEAYFSKKLYLTLDFEFNNRQIALFQMNYESNPKSNDNSYIFMVLPTEFEDKLLNFFLKNILQNKYIKKILHGSDSLDIPYVYSTLLNGSKKDIVKFTNTLTDTRFLCEYYQLNKKEESKCSIYNALLYFGTINDDKFHFLEKTHENMGPAEDVSWNIHTMSEFQVLYGLYDVLFLKKLYYDMLTKSEDDLRIYKYIIPEITRFVYLERRSITDILKIAKQQIDPMNNYMIKKINRKTNYVKNITLITIYTAVIEEIVVENPTIEIKKLMSINYFRGQISILCKKIIYHILTYKYKIHKNKTEIYKDKIEYQDLVEHMEKYNFLSLKKLVIDIKKKATPLVYQTMITM